MERCCKKSKPESSATPAVSVTPFKQDNAEHLPRWEIGLSFVVWIGHAVWCWHAAYAASRLAKNRLYPGHFVPGWALLNGVRYDASDYEWRVYNSRLRLLVACFCLRYLLRQLVLLVVGKTEACNERNLALKCFYLAMDCMFNIVIMGIKPFLVVTVHGVVIFVIGTRMWRSLLVVWVVSMLFLYSLSTDLYLVGIGKDDVQESYMLSVVVAYKLLQYISFCSEVIDASKLKRCQQWPADLFDMFYYSNYLPYSTTLIVPYENFLRQTSQNHADRIDRMAQYGKFACLAVRLAFWYFVAELILHFVYVHSIMTDANVMRQLDLASMCAMGYTVGQFFHLKYVVIFGLNALFAMTDGLDPPWPPICISRVAYYSKMWRYFDRGLYSFLKMHVFAPFASAATGQLSLSRRVVAAAACFSFIWFWHGANWHLVVWSALSFVEVICEYMGRSFAHTRRGKFSAVWRQRFGAVYGVVCVTLGLLAIFYFLGGAETGRVFVDRVVVAAVRQYVLTPPIVYLLTLGYFYNTCCAVIDRFYCRNKLY